MAASDSAISRRVEQAFAGYLDDSGDYGDFTILEAANSADPVDLPVLVVEAEDEGTPDDMPPGTGVRMIRLRVTLEANAHDTARATLDDAMQDVMGEVLDLAAVQAALNKPVGTDSRTIKPLHIYWIDMDGTDTELTEDRWSYTLEAVVTAGGHDG